MSSYAKRTEKHVVHPYVEELKDQYSKGTITRRQFLRNATLLGMSAVAATSFAPALFPETAMAAPPKRGGTWKYAVKIFRIDHVARCPITEASNVVRQVCEFLTETGSDNVTRPLLLEKWSASEDLKTWDLYLRKGIKFNNGQTLTATDVMFNMKQWLTKEVGSSMYGLLSYWGGYQNVEKVNDYHIRLHLAEPNIGLPEHLYHYHGAIVPHTFEGDFQKQPVGTGPFLLKEYVEGERVVFEARKDYWQKGADGKPLPYLDKLIYLDMSRDAAMAALSAGQIDSFYKPRPSDFLAAKGMPNVTMQGVSTAAAYVIRMRADLAPWDDNRVRTALKMCQDRNKILKLAGMNEGIIGIDAHVSPSQPEWCEKPRPKYDPQGALELMKQYSKEKDIKLPIEVKLASKNDMQEPEFAQALAELARPAGFEIKLDLTDAGGYWKRYSKVPFGITHWAHRSQATMLLPLAYSKGAKWNETHWADDEFEKLLKEATMTLDINARRQIMCKIEDIMQERGPIGISYFYNTWEPAPKKAQNVEAHPSGHNTYLKKLWLAG